MACGDKCALIFTKTTRLADSGTQIELPTKKNGFSDAWVNLPLMLVGNFASGSYVNSYRYRINIIVYAKINFILIGLDLLSDLSLRSECLVKMPFVT